MIKRMSLRCKELTQHVGWIIYIVVFYILDTTLKVEGIIIVTIVITSIIIVAVISIE